MEKMICAQCGKEDFKQCDIRDGKTFCCAVCGTKYEEDQKRKEGNKTEESPAKGGSASDGNVCMFC